MQKLVGPLFSALAAIANTLGAAVPKRTMTKAGGALLVLSGGIDLLLMLAAMVEPALAPHVRGDITTDSAQIGLGMGFLGLERRTANGGDGA